MTFTTDDQRYSTPVRVASSSDTIGPAVEEPVAYTDEEVDGEQKEEQQDAPTLTDDDIPPPPYSPPVTNLYSMSIPQSSIITQVADDQPPILPEEAFIGSGPLDQNIRLDLRGTVFDISREELLRLPESILLGISNGVLVDNGGSMMPSLSEIDAASVNFSPECLQYTLDVFRAAAENVPDEIDVPSGAVNIDDILQKRPAIIVLREDLDYYCLPLNQDSQKSSKVMQDVKEQCGKLLVDQRQIFTGLRRGDEPGSAEQHLIEMLCSSGLNINDEWGFRSAEPNKTVISSLALTRLQPAPSDGKQEQHEESTDDDNEDDSETSWSMPHKLFLFWKKPARKCWWDTLHIPSLPGHPDPIKVHIRRVWTLELSVIGARYN